MITKAGLCQTSVFTCLQNSWASQSLSHCTDSASNESCVTGFSPLAHCCFLTHLLQWSLYGTKIGRVGCPDEPNSLSRDNECPLLCTLFASVWGHATAPPRRPSFPRLNHPGFSTKPSIWNRGNGSSMLSSTPITTTCRNIENTGNFWDCMKGRIRSMTAITRAYAHAYQLVCLARYIPGVPSQKFRLLAANARYPHLPNVRTTTRERGNDFQVWAIYTDGCSRLADGETFAGWGAVARSFHGRIYVMFGPVITTEAHLAFAGSRVHSNNAAEMSATVEALSFLGHHGPVARDAHSCVFFDSKHAAGVCLGTIHARTHVHLGLSCQQLWLKVQHRLRFTMQHVHSHAENLSWKRMRRSCCCTGCVWLENKTVTFPHVGHITPLIPFHVLLPAATLGMFWKSYVTPIRSMFLPPSTKPGDSALFHTVQQGGLSCSHHVPLRYFRSFARLNLLQFA